MGGGLAESTRKYYLQEILKILRKYNRPLPAAVIICELRKIPQRRYPMTEERIVHFLKELAAYKIVRYHRSPVRKISSKWEYLETERSKNKR